MTRLFTTLMSVSILTLVIAITGCGADTDDTTADDGSQKASSDHDGHDHSDHADHASDGSTAMDKMKAELAKLSPEDAASAEKQHMCPVSDEMLGTMGPPIKVEVNGKEVWICCESCRDEIEANPEQYLAKLHDEWKTRVD